MYVNKRQRIPKGQSKKDNPKKLATSGTQYEEKQNKNTTPCVGHHYMQTNTNNVNKTCTLLQTTGGKDKQNMYSSVSSKDLIIIKGTIQNSPLKVIFKMLKVF